MRAVYTAADLNPLVKEQWHTSIGPEGPETPRPPLADDEVRFVGDPVALVVADTLYLAEDAIELVEVDYEPLPAVVDYVGAADATDLVHEQHGSNLIGELAGLPSSALDERLRVGCRTSVSATISQQAYVALPMEGRGLVVDHATGTGDLTIYAATQSPHEVRLFCSRLLGIPEHRIRVIMRDTGGGFGQKIMVQRDEMCLMLAGYVLGAPLKWIEDRRENLLAAGKSRRECADVRIAFDTDGVIQAVGIDFIADCGAYPTPWPVMTAAAVGALFPGPYRTPKASFTAKSVYTNTAGRTAYRGPWQFETLAREMLLDLAAREMRVRPRRAAAPQPAAHRRPAVHQPQRDDLRQHLAARDVRARARAARLRRVPRRAGRGARRGSLPRRRASPTTSSRRRPGTATTAPRARRSASSRRAR